MFCPKCGTQAEEGALFCQECGTCLKRDDPEPETTEDHNTEEQTGENETEDNDYKPDTPIPLNEGEDDNNGGNPVPPRPTALTALKKTASSGIFLTAVIFLTISVLFAVLAIFLTNTDVIGTIHTYAAKLDGMLPGLSVSELTDTLINALGGESNISSLINHFRISQVITYVPSVLTVLGLWLIVAAAFKKRDDNRMGSSGLVVLKTIWIIKLIFICLSAAVSLIGCILLLVLIPTLGSAIDSTSAQFGLSSEISSGVGAAASGILIAVVMFILLVLAVFYAFVIIFIAKTLQSINQAKKTAETGAPYRKISGFVAVILFIGVFFSLFSIPMLLLSMVGPGVFSAVSSIAEIMANLFFGITIFVYKSKLKRIG